MKFNNFFLINFICIFFVGIILTSCSVFQDVVNNDQNKNTQENYFRNIKIKNDDVIDIDQIPLQMRTLQVLNIIYFALDEYCIHPDFFYILDMHVDFLCNNPEYKIKIEGHTDERGTPEYNIALGERRAHAVKLYLQSKGILSKQIYTVSYGKEKPSSFGHTEESYSKNRRAVLSCQ